MYVIAPEIDMLYDLIGWRIIYTFWEMLYVCRGKKPVMENVMSLNLNSLRAIGGAEDSLEVQNMPL